MITNAFTSVFKHKSYLLLAGAMALIVFAFAVWLPNIRLLFSLVTDPTVPISVKFSFPIRLLQAITTNFTLLAASYTIAISILFGMDLAMVVYFLNRRVKEARQEGIVSGFLGLGSGVLGMGCAACGSFLLTTVLSLFGASGILALLPLKGEEFGILGVILLSVSLYLTARQIQNPAVCKIEN